MGGGQLGIRYRAPAFKRREMLLSCMDVMMIYPYAFGCRKVLSNIIAMFYSSVGCLFQVFSKPDLSLLSTTNLLLTTYSDLANVLISSVVVRCLGLFPS